MAISKGKKKQNKLGKVSFDVEVIKQDVAKEILKTNLKHTNEAISPKITAEIEEIHLNTDKVKKRKRKTEDIDVTPKKQCDPVSTKTENEGQEIHEAKEKEESNRAKKRNRYKKLIEDKKLKNELQMQEKCLNYLSMWKHSRNQWKFEKLRQIWLQQNMYDSVKIPQEFWCNLLEYFSGAKGSSRSVILKDALGIVEISEENEDDSEERRIKIHRARDIIQSLQE